MGGAREKLERLLASHCAPVLFRKKTANLVAAEQELAAYLPEVLAGSRISWIKLCSCRKYCHLLFYDRERLERYLEKEEHQEFLRAYGYDFSSWRNAMKAIRKGAENFLMRSDCFWNIPWRISRVSFCIRERMLWNADTGRCTDTWIEPERYSGSMTGSVRR